jgi:predicted dehydrogenase
LYVVPTVIPQIQYASVKNLYLLVGHHRRFNPYVVATKKFLKAESIGNITAISGLWTLCKPLPYFDAPSEWRRSSASGGPIMINLIHEIDILHYLLGPIKRVYAEKAISRRGFQAEEGAAIILRFESGVVGTFLLSDNVPSPHNFETGTGENPLIPKKETDVYRIFGTEGMLSVPDMRWSKYDGLNSWTEDIKESRVEVEMGKAPFELQVKHLVEVLAGRENPVCSGADGLRAVIVCEAVKKALDTGLPVDIEVVVS